jgi:hypothetical protein
MLACATEPTEFGGVYSIHSFYRTDLCDCGASEYSLTFDSGSVSAEHTYVCQEYTVISPFVGDYTLQGSTLWIFNAKQTWLEEATFEVIDDVIIGRWEAYGALIEVILTRR